MRRSGTTALAKLIEESDTSLLIPQFQLVPRMAGVFLRWDSSQRTGRLDCRDSGTFMASEENRRSYCAFRRRRTPFRREAEQDSGLIPNTSRSVATLALLIVREVFGLVKRPREDGSHPERSGGRRPLAGKGVRGKGRSPVPRSALERSAGVSPRLPPCYAPPPRFLRIESPFISMRWALWTRRSRIPSATVGSPICSCQRATGSCEVRIIDRVW